MVDIPVAIVGFAVVATGPATGRPVLDVTCGVALAPLALIDVAVVVRLALDRLYLAPPRSRRVVKLAADGVDILREGEVVLRRVCSASATMLAAGGFPRVFTRERASRTRSRDAQARRQCQSPG
jgi:hypothetical protein